MKINKNLKLAILLGTFVALTFLASAPVNAGLYGSPAILPAYDEVHETVDAGVEGLIPQVVTTLTALSGLVTTSFLIKKTK